MGNFLSIPAIYPSPDRDDVFILAGSLIWQNDDGSRIHGAPGFATDGLSIPRLLWGVPFVGNPWQAESLPAGLLHDGLYASEMFPRPKCDALFFEAMQARHVGKFKAWAFYLSVRFAGSEVWAHHTPESIASARRYWHYIPAKATT